MNIYTLDSDEIESREDFYRDSGQAFGLVKGGMHDLDSPRDMLMDGVLPLPLETEFAHLGEKTRHYSGAPILPFDEVEKELEGHLRSNVRHQRKKKLPNRGQYRWTRR